MYALSFCISRTGNLRATYFCSNFSVEAGTERTCQNLLCCAYISCFAKVKFVSRLIKSFVRFIWCTSSSKWINVFSLKWIYNHLLEQCFRTVFCRICEIVSPCDDTDRAPNEKQSSWYENHTQQCGFLRFTKTGKRTLQSETFMLRSWNCWWFSCFPYYKFSI